MAKRYPTVAEKRQQHQANLQRIEKGMGGAVPISFLPSNMAAGPCALAVAAAAGSYDTRTAPLAPLEGCEHPDQCGCMLTIDGDEWLASQD